MLNILAVDTGYANIKSCSKDKRYIFRSACTNNDYSANGMQPLIINGVPFYMSEGIGCSDVDKIDSDLNMSSIIYSMIQHGDTEIGVLSVGLPLSNFKAQKTKMRETILNYNKCEVVYKDKQYRINIHDVLVNRQGVSAMRLLDFKPNTEIIGIDWGGGTVLTFLLEYSDYGVKLADEDTRFYGFKRLYSKVVEQTNEKFGTKLEPEYAEKILRNGIKIEGKDQNMDYLKPLLNEYVDKFIEQLKIKFNTTTVEKIVLMGGGSEILNDTLKSKLPNVYKIQEPVFANCLGYYLAAVNKLQKGGFLGGK